MPIKQVKKFPLSIEPKQIVKMPYNSRLLDFTSADGKPMIWALCDPDNSNIDRVFVTVHEGKEVDKRMNETNFIGSYDTKADIGSVRLHVFEQT